MVGCLIFNLGILFFFKYYNFAMQSLDVILEKLGIAMGAPKLDVLLPVGISFYTFQALSYVIDVYRGEINPERNFFRYALFISFFPQLVAGPIERSKNLLQQMHEPHHFDADRAKSGLLLMGWGFFEKLVIADRIAILVTAVYNDYTAYTGAQIVMATVLFAFQIYCDFAGYSDIARGAARILGFNLMKNFNAPYYARTVSDFWRNWHISLTTWFRDYLYIPLGGNRRGKYKKYRNLFITFCVSGLWHGASWNYVIWGALNGLYQITGDITKTVRVRLQRFMRINTECWSYRLFQSLITFVMVDFAWLFFRANGAKAGLNMIKRCIQHFDFASLFALDTFLGINTLVMTEKDFFVMILGLIVLFLVDYFRTRVNLGAALERQNIVFRYIVYYVIIFAILVFGVYGPTYDAAAFIYFQF